MDPNTKIDPEDEEVEGTRDWHGTHPSMGDSFLTYQTAANLAFLGLPESGRRAEFFRLDCYEFEDDIPKNVETIKKSTPRRRLSIWQIPFLRKHALAYLRADAERQATKEMKRMVKQPS